MTVEFENPFADYGTILHGERFIGRKEDLKVIESRVVRPSEAGSLAIIGKPRIGKSSLVYKAIMERKEELIARAFLPIWINLGTYDQAAIFFRSLVTTCYDELEDRSWITEAIDRQYKQLLQNELSWNEDYPQIKRFFEKVRQAGIRVLFILDEFDHARFLFKDDKVSFQRLRDLGYYPEQKVIFVTTSRRSIHDIEERSIGTSTFDGIFHKHYLSLFDKTDMDEYYNRLATVHVMVDTSLKNQIVRYCGGHPYLLEALGYEMVEVFREYQQTDAERALKRVEASFIDHYDRIRDLLAEDGTLTKILQILFGPVIDVKQTDVDELVRYGLITLTDQQVYVAFSSHFQLYLQLIEREVDLWPLWSETEKALRRIIATKMAEKFGDDWIVHLEKARPNVKTLFEKARQAQQNEVKAFGTRASQSLLDFTYPQDLFTILFAEWKDTFQSLLGQDKNYWQQCANLLSRIRNPLAHNRDHVLYEADVNKAEGYCKEIRALLG